MMNSHQRKFFKKLLLSRKEWRCPVKADLLIFDAEGAELFTPYFKSKINILHIRGESLNVPIAALAFLKSGSNFWSAYKDEYIKWASPKIIITYIDNNFEFYFLSKKFPKSKTMVVQNGIRGAEFFEQLSQFRKQGLELNVDNIFTFNHAVGEIYSKYITGKVYPIGSFRNNLYSKNSIKQDKKIDDLMIYISQYRKVKKINVGSQEYSQHDFFQQAERFVLSFLNEYAIKNNKKLFIAPVTKGCIDEERSYYLKNFNLDLEFLSPRKDGGNYYWADSAEVVVTIDSTLGYESLARGNKTAFFSIRGEILGLPCRSFGWPSLFKKTGPFWTNSPDHNSFKKILDHLFTIDQWEWCKEIEAFKVGEILRADTNNLTFSTILKRELEGLK